MADAATISVTATMLPDEIAKTITGSMTVTPTDANDKWYYKLTGITTTSAVLIAGSGSIIASLLLSSTSDIISFFS